MTRDLSVVIPVLNEEFNVNKLVDELKKNVLKISEDFEIIFIDDGSVDDTWAVIEKEAKLDNRIIGLKLSRNFGHHYAITAGIHQAIGNWVVVMDGDLQDRPDVIPHLVEKANQGFDVVFVNRVDRPESLSYKVLQKIFYSILRFLSGFDFVSRHGKRFQGKPSYTLRKRFKLASDIILAFSDRPLRMAIGLGITISLLSILMVIWIVIGVYSWGFTVIGWPSLVAAIFFSTGIILIVLGIIWVYLGQIFREVKSRPLYIISETTN